MLHETTLTPLGLALDSRLKGCYAPKSDGGHKGKICF